MKEWVCANYSIAKHPLVQALARSEGAQLRVRLCGRQEQERTFLGWGLRPSGRWARRMAARTASGFLLLEDGFIRSLRPGGRVPGSLYSLVADSRGIYYGPGHESDMHVLIDQPRQPSPETARLLTRFLESGVSKYNWFPGRYLPKSEVDRFFDDAAVLLIDQTRGDEALAVNDLGEQDFLRLFEIVIERHPTGNILVRSHPDAEIRGRSSCFSSVVWNHPRVRAVPASLLPRDCFSRVSEVHVMNSLLGFEALLHGATVYCHAPSFYSGCGHTVDVFDAREVPTSCSLEKLFWCAYETYSRYFDPVTGRPCTLGRILDHVERQIHFHAKAHGCSFSYPSMPRWKRQIVASFLADRGQRDRFFSAQRDKAVEVLWGGGSRRERPAVRDDSSLLRVEDGFLRSVGLGLDFHYPVSLAVDEVGMYYDASGPSDLEHILQNEAPGPLELEAADELLCRIREAGVTKYNLRRTDFRAPSIDVLVVGQVEGDASIRFGLPEVCNNRDLLVRVREEFPDASIAYKPHPDVEMGLRPGRISRDEVLQYADILVEGSELLPWIESAATVAVITSLAGFEALLRGTAVRCYGLPFYAGWGLTTDRVYCPRRTRELSLAELVHGALVAYPRYLHPVSREFVSVQDAVLILSDPVMMLAGKPPLPLRAFAMARLGIRKGRNLIRSAASRTAGSGTGHM